MLQHASLETRPGDVADAVRFWKLLGFERVDAPGALRERSTWVQRGGTQIHLLNADDPVVPAEGHVAVVCEDYDAALGRLRAAGYDPEPREEYWGAPRCMVHAPGGHRVEVMARPPA